MAKGRATRDVIKDEKCNKMREQKDIKRQNEINKPWNHLRAMKRAQKSDHQKSDLKNRDEQRLSTANQRQGRQHQRQLNFDPTQRDVVSNISQNLRKKRTNIDQNNLQRCKKKPHNMELIFLIYNKYQIISQKKKVRKNKSTEVKSFSSDGEKHCTMEK